MAQFSDAITFSRGTPTYGFDPNNLLQQFPTNGPNLGFINGAQGFTIEGSSQNIALRSIEFDNAAVWVLTGSATCAPSLLVAPDGTLTGDVIADPSSTVFSFARQTLTVANDSSVYAASLFFKKTVGSQSSFPALRVRYTTGGTLTSAIALLDTTFGLTATNSVFPVLVEDAGGWWRYTMVTSNNNTGNTNLQFDILPAAANSLSLSSSIDVTANGSCGIWGAQVEKLPFRTAYIPTSDAAIRRSPDSASFNASSYTGGTFLNAFSVYAAVYIPVSFGVSSVFPIWSIDNAQTSQQIQIYATSSGTINQRAVSSGVQQYDAAITTALTFPREVTLATRVQSGVMVTSLNRGPLVVSSGVVVNSLSTFREGNNIAGDRFFGTERVLHFTPKLIDDASLMAWTI